MRAIRQFSEGAKEKTKILDYWRFLFVTFIGDFD
jgi:hypothetical protein